MTHKIAKQIIAEARQSRTNYAVTQQPYDKIKANMYTIFECYARGIIDWDLSKAKLQNVIKEYVNLYPLEERKAEVKIMREEYKRMTTDYKLALDEYRVVAEQKMTSSLVAKQKLDESTAQHHSNVFYNGRNLTEADLKDIATLKTWQRVMEAYPNLTTKDEELVRTLENTYDTKDFEFNPRAGHRDQMAHPENQGLGTSSIRPKLRPKPLAPISSPRPQARPANLQMRNDINKAVQQAVGEGDSPHKKGTAKYKAHMAAMHAEGYKVMPPMDPKYVERSGLEGPFTTLSGKVVYYDPKEGSYYDPDTDIYMSYDEFQNYDKDYSGMKDERDEVKEHENEYTASDIMSDDLPVGIDFDTSNLPKVNWDMHSVEEIKLFVNNLENLDFEDGVDVSDSGYDGSSGEAAKWVEKNVLSRRSDEVSEEMSDEQIDAFHTALDTLVHKHLGHSSDERDEVKENPTPGRGDGRAEVRQRQQDAEADDFLNRVAAHTQKTDNFLGTINPAIDNPVAVGLRNRQNRVKETLSPEEKKQINQMYNKDGTLTDIGRQVMNHGKKKASKKTDESTAGGLTQSVMARAIEEMTSAGAIASVATPMGKMKRRKDTIFADKESNQTAISEAQFDEAAGEKDACYNKVKSRYKVWPSAYASGALTKCRKVGAANWGKSKK